MSDCTQKMLLALLTLLLCWPGGTLFCRAVLRWAGLTAARGAEAAGKELRIGRWIGYLERTLILIGVIWHAWEIIAVVVALKTVARYKELDKKINAEYFLVGSLASLLWGFVAALPWLFVTQCAQRCFYK